MKYFEGHFRRIRTAAQSVATRRPYDVLLFSQRREFFDPGEFTHVPGGPIKSVVLVSSMQELQAIQRSFDVAVMCSHVQPDDRFALYEMRRRNLAHFIFVWTFDNHHSADSNWIINSLSDVVAPAHKYCAGYLRSPFTILGAHVPLSTGQWSRARARAFFAASMQKPREDGLHGGFVDWPKLGSDRTRLAKECSARLPGNAITVIDDTQRHGYFGLSAEERWRDWASHKVGLILPLTCDLSIRFYDSLLTGQVPLVPTWCLDLDAVIPPGMQESLPVIRFDQPTVEAVETAWREGVRRFDAGGKTAMLHRHTFALENHHVVNRLKALCGQIDEVAQLKNIPFKFDKDGPGFALPSVE